MLRQQLSRAFAYKLNSQRINQPRQRIFLACFDLLQQILRGLLRHAPQRSHFLFFFFQRIQIGDVLHHSFVHQLVHDLFSQPVNIQRAPTRKM